MIEKGRSCYTTIEAAPFNIILAVLYSLLISVYLISAEGLFDATGHIIGRDFINIWTAGALLATDHLSDIFDHASYQALQEQLFGRELPPHNWSYPPHMLFIGAAVAWLPYLPALALWSLLTPAAYLLACQPLLPRPHNLVLLLAPAVFINFFFGQTGCLVAVLLIGALGMLDRRPILAGVLFGLVSIKPPLGLLVPLALVAARAWRTIASAALTVVAMVVLSGWVFGWETWQAWLDITVPFQTLILEKGTGLFTQMMPSAFMGGRLVGLTAEYAYLVQFPFTLFAAGTMYWAFHRRGPTPLAVAVLLLSTAVATPYIHNYDLVLISPAVLIVLSYGRSEGFRSGESLVWLSVWLLPIMVMMFNRIGLPISCFILTTALGLVIVRLRDQSAKRPEGNPPRADGSTTSRTRPAPASKPRPRLLSHAFLLYLCLFLSFPVSLAPHAWADVIAAMGAREIRASRTLVGAVHTVQTERVLFVNPPGESDTWIEDERILTAIAQYGMNGELTERTEYAPDGAAMIRVVRQYNRAHKLSTEHLYNSQGALWRKTSHTYDEAGRLTQAVSTDVDGDLWFRDVYTYTEDGRPAHIDHHDPDGTFLHRASFTYDGEGRVAKRSLSDADGSPISSNTYVYDAEQRVQSVITNGRSGALTSRWVYAYDEHGNEREWVASDRDGAIQRKEVYTYEYDIHGNWVKQVTAEWIPDGAGGYLEPAEAIYRTITYYPQEGIEGAERQKNGEP